MEAQAVARVWSGDWKIPVQMLPRVQQLRDEAKQAEQAKSFTILTATLIAGVLALLLMLWSKLVSWALIALLSNVGIFALWRLLRFLESQWKARRTTNILEWINEEFRPRTKQASLPDEAAVLLLYGCVVNRSSCAGSMAYRYIQATDSTEGSVRSG